MDYLLFFRGRLLNASSHATGRGLTVFILDRTLGALVDLINVTGSVAAHIVCTSSGHRASLRLGRATRPLFETSRLAKVHNVTSLEHRSEPAACMAWTAG